MKNAISTALHDQKDAKKRASTSPKDGVKTIHRVGLGVKVMDQIKRRQLIKRFDITYSVADANDAVKRIVFIQDADQHPLFSDGTTFDNFGIKGIENLDIQFSDIFVGDEGCFQELPLVDLNGISRPSTVMCAKKYRCKFALNSQIEGRFKYPAMFRQFCPRSFMWLCDVCACLRSGAWLGGGWSRCQSKSRTLF